VTIQPFLTVVQDLLGDAGIVSIDTASKFRVVASALFVLLALPILIRRKFGLMVLTYFIVLVVFGCSLVINPFVEPYVINEGLKLTLPICLPVFLSFVSIEDKDLLMKVFLYTGGAIALISIIYTYYLLQGRLTTESIYNMSIGYSLLYPIILFWASGKKILQVASVLLTILVFFIGSRGPVLVFLIYVVITLFRNRKISKIIPYIIIIPLVAANLDSFFVFLENWFGFESRTLSLVTSGELISHTSGRDEIYALARNAIKNAPFLGYGIFGDRVVLQAFSHNFVYEVLLDFGEFFGVIYLVVFAFIIIRTFLIADNENRDVFLMFFVMSMVPLMVSGSFTKDINFYIFLGVLYSINENNKTRKRANDLSLKHS
jgi:hypothetical protein